MKTHWKKYLAAMLSVCLLLSALPVNAFAEEVAEEPSVPASVEETTSVTEPVEETEKTEENTTEETQSLEEGTEATENVDEETSDEANESKARTTEEIPVLDSDEGLLKAGSDQGPTGTTTEQPFASGTAGSKYFRIPAMITLQNGWIITAADARYGTAGDGGGLDTIVSISKDNGKTWEYSMPIYFPDSDGYYGTSATTVIDPIVVQGNDGTIYVMADANPTGVTTMTGFTSPNVGTGYITIDGVERLPLTSNYSNVNTTPTEDDIDTYEYYVGDFSDGYAPVIDRATGETTEYLVDSCYNIYIRNEDGSLSYPYQTQVNSDTKIQQNAFYKDSVLHVYNTGYLWLATSTDNGATWTHSILNTQIKRDSESALLVSPGRGTVLSDGTIIMPYYNHYDTAATPSTECSSFIWSKDNGATWHRTGDVPTTNGFSSESEIVELADGTLRLFARNNTGTVAYADAVWTGSNYEWQTAVVSTDISCCSTCNVSAIMYSQQIDGKDAILVACPGGSGRINGRIFVFLVDEDNAMRLAYTYEVNDSTFQYSCLTELPDGNIALLWEYSSAAITYSTYTIDEICKGSVINGVRKLNVPLYGSYTETIAGAFTPDGTCDETIVTVTYNTETISGTLALLGSDSTFGGESISLLECLYTFTGNSESGWVVESVSYPGIYLNHAAVSAGFPNATTASTIILYDGVEEGTCSLYTSNGIWSGRLYFWKTQKSGKTYSYDRQSGADKNYGCTDFLLYRPVKDGENSSTEIPGFVNVTTEDPVNGESYLIVAKVDNSYFVLHPSTNTTDRYAHVAKVGGVSSVTTTTITYTGIQEGTTSFVETTSGYTYALTVKPAQLVEVTTTTKLSVDVDLDAAGEITVQPDETVAKAEVVSKSVTNVYTGGQGNLGTTADFTGDLAPLSDALYTFTLNDDGSYTVSAKTTDGTEVFLFVSTSGYPNKTTADQIQIGNLDENIFTLWSVKGGRYLHFHDGRFDQVTAITSGSYDFTDGVSFLLYRPVKDGETGSTELPGYVQITRSEGIVDGGVYLIVSGTSGDYYALYPSTSTSNMYQQVIKVNADAETVTKEYSENYTRLHIDPVSEGTTDVMVNGIVYRITVTSDVPVADAETALPKAGSNQGPTGTTTEQPFASGTADSKYFRIPAMVTLQNGWIITAADARYGTTGDGGGLDTIVSISKDNGETWEYSMPIYFPDSNGYAGNKATTVIDPILVQGGDGTIYLMADVNPTGVTTMSGFTWPNVGTGYINVDGVERLALTSNYDNVNTAPTEDDTTTYEYYVGDFAKGYAPVINRTTGEDTRYVVDTCYNLYVKNADGSLSLPYQTQVNSETEIQQNVFYQDSVLHVYNTGYLWLATSTDNGATWTHQILNPSIKHDDETALLVSPGRGTVLSDGTIVMPFYTHDKSGSYPYYEWTSFIWSKDNGKTWQRSENVPTTNYFSSEAELVELADGTLRLFARNYLGNVAYTDGHWDEAKQNYVWDSGMISTGVACCSTCNVSAIMYSQKIDGKDAILVACPSDTASRSAGRIFVFLVEDDNTMHLAYTFEVNETEYSYSCLTELTDGSIGLLWEHYSGGIRYDSYAITDVAQGALINGKRVLTVPLYETLTDLLEGEFKPDTTIDSSIVAVEVETVEGEDGKTYTKVTYTGIQEGTVSFTETTSGVAYVVNVEAADLVEITLDEDAVETIQLKTEGIIKVQPDETVATVETESESFSSTYTGGQGKYYGGKYQPLSDALFIFEEAEDGTYKVYNYDSDGSKRYLSLGTAWIPTRSEVDYTVVTELGNGEFSLFTCNESLYLEFPRETSYYGYYYQEDQEGFEAYTEDCSFLLYRPAKDGEEGSTEIPGYVRITSTSEIENKGAYLIVAPIDTTSAPTLEYVALYPAVNNAWYQTMAVMPSMDMVTASYHFAETTLTITAVAPGTTDAMVDGTIYRITVSGFKAPVFQWTEDLSGAKATFTHTVTGETAVLDCQISKQTVNGVTAYTATVTHNGKTYTNTVMVVVENHAYSAPTFVWAEDYTCVTAVFTCGICGDVQKLDCTVKKVTNEASCTEDGSVVYTATVEFGGMTFTDTKTEVLEATGHSYGNVTFEWNSDYTACNAKQTCAGCGDVKKTSCTVTIKIDKAATTTEEGSKTVTATVEIDGETYTATKTLTIPVLSSADQNSPATGDMLSVMMFTMCILSAVAYVALAYQWKKRRS